RQYFVVFFFFSSRRRHTRFSRDWSSDVCSSDLYSEYSMQQNGGERWLLAQHGASAMWPRVRQFLSDYRVPVARESATLGELETRSEERRVGKEWRSRW